MKVLICVFLAISLGQVAAETFAEKMVLATYKLFNDKSTATGFVVEVEDGKRFVVTAGHVFEKMEGEKMVLVLRKKMPDGTYERHDVDVPVREGKKELWMKHEKQDIAVLELDLKLPDGVEIRSIPLGSLATEESGLASGLGVGVDVLICGFPTRFEVNGAGFPVTRRGCVASFPLVPIAEHATMVVDFSTFEGDSGGPVFLKREGDGDEPLVVGLVIAQFRHTEKLKRFDGEQTIHHPLGLATVVQSELILEILKAAGKSK